MPKILSYGMYIIYFWSNEKGEPIHVHIGIKRPAENDTKLWLLRTGDTVLVHNNNNIPSKELKKLQELIKTNKKKIISEWSARFDSVEFYNKLEEVKK